MTKSHLLSQSSLAFLQPLSSPDSCFVRPELLSRVSCCQREQALSAEMDYLLVKPYFAAKNVVICPTASSASQITGVQMTPPVWPAAQGGCGGYAKLQT